MNGTLIRDNIPEVVKAQGGACNYVEIKSDALYSNMLRDKLVETVNLFLQYNSAETLAEVKTVVEAIADEAREAFDAIYAQQQSEFGGYTARYAFVRAEYGSPAAATTTAEADVTEPVAEAVSETSVEEQPVTEAAKTTTKGCSHTGCACHSHKH